MRNLSILFAVCTLLMLSGCHKKAIKLSIIPNPNSINIVSGTTIIHDSIAIKLLCKCSKAAEIAALLKENFTKFTGIPAFIVDSAYAGKPVIYLSIIQNSGALGDEGYILKIKSDSIIATANASQGLFYATQSLLQLVSETANFESKSVSITNCVLNDYPRYPWRGMHLDVSRHFFDKKFIFKYLDAMALHKLNVFHWHLADDQGWRVEIKKYPKLTEIGAWREDQEDKEWSYFQYPDNDKLKKLYGGFYTQNDIREIVKYAASRQILIVPEIDVPGHSTAAIYAYPELSCSKKPWKKAENLPFEFSHPLCAGNEFTYKFLEDVLGELCELFPGPYFHIGGDECNHAPWETCKACQLTIAKNNLKGVKELQSYFNLQLEKFLISKQKRLIGWEEIAEGGMSAAAMLMSWKGEEAGIVAARNHQQVIMVPSNHLYFDSYQENAADEEKTQSNVNTLEEVYGYDPDPKILGPADYRSIYGVQACLWTEYVASDKKAERLLFPRLCSLSEVAWTMPQNKNLENFKTRLLEHYNFLDKAQLSYFIPMPSGVSNELVITGKTEIKLSNKFGKGKIYYTTDGSDPTSNSQVYEKPIATDKSMVLKAKIIVNTETSSLTRVCNVLLKNPQVSQNIQNVKSGLSVTYSEGLINTFADWNKLKLIKTDTISGFYIPNYTKADSFGLEFNGYIKIPETGVYTFTLASDDGTLLFINDSLLINNDGCHGPSEVDKQVALMAGFHKIKLRYFEALYGNALEVSISGTSLKKQLIQSALLYH